MAGYQPDAGDVHVNRLLTDISVAYTNSQDAFVADRVAPPVYVDKQSDLIPEYNRGDWLRDVAARRGPGTLARRSGYSVTTTATYFCINWAIGKDVPVEVSANADLPFDMIRDGTEWVTEQMTLRREVEFASAAMTSGVWNTDVTGGSSFQKWNDYAASDPIGDIRTGVRSIRQQTGRRPNVLAMGEIVWNRLQDHPDLLDRIKGAASPGNPAIVTRGLVAGVLELEDVAVASALRVTSAEGATVTVADVIDDDALLLYRPRRPSIFQPAALYGFIWRPLVGNVPQFIRSYDESDKRNVVVEGHSYFDYRRVSTLSGYFFVDAVD